MVAFVAEGHLLGEARDAFGDDALRGQQKLDRLLAPAALQVQPLLLAGVLGVVAGVGFVADQVAQAVGANGRVGVNIDRDLPLPRYQL
jgi:hypothetical protein